MRGEVRGYIKLFAVTTCCMMLSVPFTQGTAATQTTSGESISAIDPSLRNLFKSMPADYFTENAGQLGNPDILFYSMDTNMQIGFAESAVYINILEPQRTPDAEHSMNQRLRHSSPPGLGPSRGVLLRLGFEEANKVIPQGEESLPFSSNFFIGSSPDRWHTNVRSYGRVVYRGLYDGIDLIYLATDGGVKYNLISAPGTDLNTIRISYEGASSIELNPEGGLLVHTAVGDLSDTPPIAYQASNRPKCSFVLLSSTSLGFNCDRVDESSELVIDPLLYSTYLGGSYWNQGNSMAVDSSGNAYVTGVTLSADFPVTPGAYDTTLNGTRDVFVTKLNPSGSSLVYSTYLGGDSSEEGNAIVVDSAGNAYIFGDTSGSDFPVTAGAYDTTFNGAWDLFVTKLDPTGASLEYSTYIGGSFGGLGEDWARDISVSSDGSAYVTGYTDSTDFPVTPDAYDGIRNGIDAYLAKLNPAGDRLQYSTFLGGADVEEAHSIEIDPASNIYLTGFTRSTDFPITPGAFDSSLGGVVDAFVLEMNLTIGTLLYSTFLGGQSAEEGNSISVDETGSAYVTGYTSSTDFPTSSDAFDSTNNGARDSFMTKFNSTGESLIYSTYLGGGSTDNGLSIAHDALGNAYVAGYSFSANFPVTSGAFDAIHNGSTDGFMSRLNIAGNRLLYSTFLGGSNNDQARSIVIDTAGDVYLMGITASTDFPVTPGAFHTTYDAVNGDTFVSKFSRYEVDIAPNASNLGVQGKISPPEILHITDSTPSLNWTYCDLEGSPQASYDVRIGSAPGLGDVWDPPATSGNATVVTYGGAPLFRGVDYYFGVKVNDSLLWSAEIEVMFHTNSIPNPPIAPIVPTQFAIVPSSTSQTISWTPGGDNESDVTTFEWQVSTDASFSPIVAEGMTMNTTSTAFATALSSTYYWRVRARDDYEPMTWSAYGNEPEGYWTFIANSPPVAVNLGVQGFTSPPGIVHITDFMPDLNWTYSDVNSQLQTQYWVMVGTTSGGADVWNPGQQAGAVASVTYAGTALQRGVDYFFSVAVCDGMNWSSFSEVMFRLNSVPTPPTTPIVPINASLIVANSSQILSWSSGSDPDSDIMTFEWQVSIDRAFATVIASGTTTSTVSSPFSTNPSMSYFWRVRAQDSWETSTWSAYGNAPEGYWTFTTNTPPFAVALGVQGFTSPPGIVHIVDPAPDLNWTYGDFNNNTQIQYHVMVGTVSGGADMWDPGRLAGALTSVTYVGSTLLRGVDYFLSVTVFDGLDWGSSSEILFRLNSIPSPPTVPTAPGDAAVIAASPFQTVSWTSGGDPDSGDTIAFEWQVATDAAFTSVISSATTTSTTSSSFATSYSTTYFWRVRAHDNWEITTWSAYGNSPPGYWTFSTLSNNPPTIEISSPSGGETWIRGSSHTISWAASDDEDISSALLVWINYTSGAGGGSICGPVAGDTGSCPWILPPITASDVIVNGTAIDTGGLKGYDESGSFTIQAPLNTPPVMAIDYPSGGEVFHWGDSPTVAWTASDVEDTTASLTFWINYTSGTGNGVICGPLLGVWSCNWPLPSITATDVVINGTVIDTGGLKGYDESGLFAINPPPNTPPTVSITSPVGGEEWLKGSLHTLTWTMHDDEDINANLTVYLNYTTLGVAHPIVAALKGELFFTWTIPDVEATDVVVNITVIDSGGLKNWSQSGPFTIKAPPTTPPPSSDFIGQYWWLIVVVVVVIVMVLLLTLMKRRKPEEEQKGDEDPQSSEEEDTLSEDEQTEEEEEKQTSETDRASQDEKEVPWRNR